MKAIRRSDIFSVLASMEVIIFCTVCFLGKIYGGTLFGDPDVGWHLMAGEYIRDLGYIPKSDPWSHISSGQVWYNLSWLWDVIISMVYQFVGLQGLCNLSVVVHAFVLVLLFRELKTTYKVPHEDTALATTAISGLILFDALYIRPQLAAYFLILVFMRILEGYRSRSSYLTALYTALIAVVWVNVHGTFLLIWVIGGVYFLEAAMEKRWKDALSLSGIGVVAVIASFINPWGWDVYVGTIRTLHTAIRPHIAEWKPFIFGTQYGGTIVLLLTLATGFIGNKIPFRYKLMAGFMLVNALMAIRNWQTFSIIGAPFVAWSLESVYSYVKPSDNVIIKKYGQSICAVFAAVMMVYSFTIIKQIDKDNSPLDEINFVLQNYPDKKIYNEYDHGGPIIFHGKGKIKHFIDGRAGTAFSEDTIEKYVSFLKEDQSWEWLFNFFPVDVAIVSKSHFRQVKTHDFFDGWYLVFEGKVAKVYVKEEPKSKPVILA